mgnify:CR=1 FL=1
MILVYHGLDWFWAHNRTAGAAVMFAERLLQ